jgi:hypothetical protein
LRQASIRQERKRANDDMAGDKSFMATTKLKKNGHQ